MSDQVVMVDGNARIHLGGPSIVKVAINEDADAETLGGANMYGRVSGVSDHLARKEQHAIALVRDIVAEPNMGRRMHCGMSPLPPAYNAEEINGIVSYDRKIPYDVREINVRIVAASAFREFKPK